MNSVDHGMLEQVADPRCVFRATTQRPLDRAIEVLIMEPRQEIPHKSFDLLPPIANRCQGWIVRALECGATWRPTTSVQPSPLGTHDMNQGISDRAVAPCHRFNELFIGEP